MPPARLRCGCVTSGGEVLILNGAKTASAAADVSRCWRPPTTTTDYWHGTGTAHLVPYPHTEAGWTWEPVVARPRPGADLVIPDCTDWRRVRLFNTTQVLCGTAGVRRSSAPGFVGCQRAANRRGGCLTPTAGDRAWLMPPEFPADTEVAVTVGDACFLWRQTGRCGDRCSGRPVLPPTHHPTIPEGPDRHGSPGVASRGAFHGRPGLRLRARFPATSTAGRGQPWWWNYHGTAVVSNRCEPTPRTSTCLFRVGESPPNDNVPLGASVFDIGVTLGTFCSVPSSTRAAIRGDAARPLYVRAASPRVLT